MKQQIDKVKYFLIEYEDCLDTEKVTSGMSQDELVGMFISIDWAEIRHDTQGILIELEEAIALKDELKDTGKRHTQKKDAHKRAGVSGEAFIQRLMETIQIYKDKVDPEIYAKACWKIGQLHTIVVYDRFYQGHQLVEATKTALQLNKWGLLPVGWSCQTIFGDVTVDGVWN